MQREPESMEYAEHNLTTPRQVCYLIGMSTTTKTRKQLQSLSDLPDKQVAFALLRQQGLSVREAAKVLNYKRSTAYTYESRIKKLDLTAPKMVKKAHRAIEKLVAGKAFGDLETVKDSTALRAAEIIVDRSQPKVTRTENLNVNVGLSPVDLSRYRGGPVVEAEARDAGDSGQDTP